MTQRVLWILSALVFSIFLINTLDSKEREIPNTFQHIDKITKPYHTIESDKSYHIVPKRVIDSSQKLYYIFSLGFDIDKIKVHGLIEKDRFYLHGGPWIALEPTGLEDISVKAETKISHKRQCMQEILFVGSCLLYTSPSPRDRTRSRMPSSA